MIFVIDSIEMVVPEVPGLIAGFTFDNFKIFCELIVLITWLDTHVNGRWGTVSENIIDLILIFSESIHTHHHLFIRGYFFLPPI